jgi:hypothetical protein
MKLNNFLKIFSILTYAVILLFANYSIAAGSTYIGIAGLYSHLRLPNSYGGNVFSRKMASGFNLSLGHMFNDNFGWEAGVEFNKRNNREVFINKEESVFGVTPEDPLLVYSYYKSKINQTHLYGGILSKITILDTSFFSILIGGSLSNIKLKARLLGEQLIHPFSGIKAFYPTYYPYSFNKRQILPIIQLAFGYQNKNQYNLKIFSTWKRTSTEDVVSKESSTTRKDVLRLKNIINIGAGFYYYIF